MTTKQIVDSIMSKSGAPVPSEVYGRLGVNSNVFANQMKRGIKTVRLLSKVLRVLGYRMIVVPIDVETKQDWFDID